MDEDLKHFMVQWFSGLMAGIAQADGKSQETILRECGKGCANSYTGAVFREAKQHGADLEAFLANLTQRFPEATYVQIDSQKIRVEYSRCACDLVKYELVQSPLICECSAYNLQENFEQALGTAVLVTIEASILRGDSHCMFLVSLNHGNEP